MAQNDKVRELGIELDREALEAAAARFWAGYEFGERYWSKSWAELTDSGLWLEVADHVRDVIAEAITAYLGARGSDAGADRCFVAIDPDPEALALADELRQVAGRIAAAGGISRVRVSGVGALGLRRPGRGSADGSE